MRTQPERIQGAPYSVKSDVWSLGITLIELSVGQFPFSGSFDSDEEEEDDPSLLTRSGVEDEDGRELPSPPPSPPPKDRDSVQLQLPVHRESLPPRSDSLPAHRDRDSLPPPSANHNRDSLQVPLSATTKRRNRRRSKGVSLHGSQATLSILELMHAIINEPSPRLPRNKFDKEVEDFVGGCLEKDPEKRGQGGLGALFVSCFCFAFLKFGEEGEEWNANTFLLFAGLPLDPPLAHERRRYARLGGDVLSFDRGQCLQTAQCTLYALSSNFSLSIAVSPFFLSLCTYFCRST